MSPFSPLLVCTAQYDRIPVPGKAKGILVNKLTRDGASRCSLQVEVDVGQGTPLSVGLLDYNRVCIIEAGGAVCAITFVLVIAGLVCPIPKLNLDLKTPHRRHHGVIATVITLIGFLHMNPLAVNTTRPIDGVLI